MAERGPTPEDAIDAAFLATYLLHKKLVLTTRAGLIMNVMHYQVISDSILGSSFYRSVCGSGRGGLTDEWRKVTCKKCRHLIGGYDDKD